MFYCLRLTSSTSYDLVYEEKEQEEIHLDYSQRKEDQTFNYTWWSRESLPDNLVEPNNRWPRVQGKDEWVSQQGNRDSPAVDDGKRGGHEGHVEDRATPWNEKSGVLIVDDGMIN